MDGLVTSMIGTIKGIGKQAPATFAYLVCFYLISVPFSYFFCFGLKLGIRGLWIGLSTGLIILLLTLALIIYRADWYKIASQAKENFMKESLIFRSSTMMEGIECCSNLRCYSPYDRESSVLKGSFDIEAREFYKH